MAGSRPFRVWAPEPRCRESRPFLFPLRQRTCGKDTDPSILLGPKRPALLIDGEGGWRALLSSRPSRGCIASISGFKLARRPNQDRVVQPVGSFLFHEVGLPCTLESLLLHPCSGGRAFDRMPVPAQPAIDKLSVRARPLQQGTVSRSEDVSHRHDGRSSSN